MGVAPSRRTPQSGMAALLAGLGVVLAIGLASAIIVEQRADAPAPAAMHGGNPIAVPAPVPVVTHVVVYQLTGAGDALTVTYVGQGAAIQQVAEAPLPWSASLEHTSPVGSAQYLSLTARNTGPGSLGCRIVVDGATVSEASAGPQDVVRCTKSLR